MLLNVLLICCRWIGYLVPLSSARLIKLVNRSPGQWSLILF